MKRTLYISFFLLLAIRAAAQVPDSIAAELYLHAGAAKQFGQALPQEKVYVHMDNTSYYHGDHIWFQCYVVTAGENRPTPLSKTLYVELLDQSGETMARQILPVENGRCHGDFALTQQPFRSGFYELRAYTKYMLSFGETTYFSRMVPVFESPDIEGDYAQKEIKKYHFNDYVPLRERAKKGKRLNLRFYPEGGYLVEGLEERVAFEATDAYGNPVDVEGTVEDEEGRRLATFRTLHEGRGVFTCTPREGKMRAVVRRKDKTYKFRLPEVRPQGVTFSVNNTNCPDSIKVQVQKHPEMPDTALGLALTHGGKLHRFCILSLTDDHPVHYTLNGHGLPPGVAQVVLFGHSGRIVADRLIFTGRPDTLSVTARFDKATYQPYDSVRLELRVTDTKGEPVRAPLSVSVRDDYEEVTSHRSLLTDLLLMSEIKGYVHRPDWYFEADDSLHRHALDQLLMVQGWRRYDWETWAGAKPFTLACPPEQGIDVRGQVVSMARSKPRPGVDMTCLLQERGKEDEQAKATYIDYFKTDSLGRFAFSTKAHGKWHMILSATKKGKKKNYRIVLDRVFSPEPGMYPPAGMQVEVAGQCEAEIPKETAETDTLGLSKDDYARFMDAYEDSLRRVGITDKIHRLDEVVVKAKKRDKANDIYQARMKSMAYYDVASEVDDILDRNGFVGQDIHEVLIHMQPGFSRMNTGSHEYLMYQGKLVLFVVNYERTYWDELDYFKYQNLTLESIKSIYINTDPVTMMQYADPRYFNALTIDDAFGCAVLIETYPEEKIPARAGKGVRKTWLEGYSEVKEFYHPDYRAMPPESDYRRTLYWNPKLETDEEGLTTVRFYNNSRCRRPRVTAETLTGEGSIGVLNQ